MERHGLSQRHACRLVGIDRSTLRYRASGQMTGRCDSDCANWPRNADDSGIGDWVGCWPAKVMS